MEAGHQPVVGYLQERWLRMGVHIFMDCDNPKISKIYWLLMVSITPYNFEQCSYTISIHCSMITSTFEASKAQV
jgi:hypothetical protein